MATRREFLKAGATGAGLWLASRYSSRSLFAQVLPGGTLPPELVPKFVTPLVLPPAMPRTARLKVRGGRDVDYYEIAVRQFSQQILPNGMPRTAVWSYGAASDPATFHYPAFTIEAKADTPVRVKWTNQLYDAAGGYLPHLLPVDPTLHWANPPGGVSGRDSRPSFKRTPPPYTGPVPIVTHVHGAHASEEADGFSEAWFLPPAANVPAEYARTGTWYNAFKEKAEPVLAQAWTPGSAVCEYANDQAATTLWYHDHTLGMTRANVYAGPAGFYLIRGGRYDVEPGVLPGPAPTRNSAPGLPAYEIPIVIQDRSFNADGSLFYPDTRAFFDGFAGQYVPRSDVPPIWNPEFFGNMMVVNGRAWPKLQVEPRRYRFRLLNGCNSRFLILAMGNGQPLWQIGGDGGFLASPVALSQLLVAPAERADVIVDFTGLPVGTQIVLRNYGPDEPFGGGEWGIDFVPADPSSTGQVMMFQVVPLASPDTSTPPGQLTLPAPSIPAGAVSVTRQLSLNEMESSYRRFDGPVAALLGALSDGAGVPLMWDDPITETPAVGATEVWEFHNFTEDAHPVHVHQVQFQVLDRIDAAGFARPPEAWETGAKDTVVSYPGEITRVKASFDLAGLYAWHCHIVEHEDNEMMRPFRVG